LWVEGNDGADKLQIPTGNSYTYFYTHRKWPIVHFKRIANSAG